MKPSLNRKKSVIQFVAVLVLLIYFVIALVLYFAGCYGNNNVYVCTRPSSHVYHVYRYCEGLENCSKEIKAVSLDVATTSMNRTQCNFCKKKEERIDWDDNLDRSQ